VKDYEPQIPVDYLDSPQQVLEFGGLQTDQFSASSSESCQPLTSQTSQAEPTCKSSDYRRRVVASRDGFGEQLIETSDASVGPTFVTRDSETLHFVKLQTGLIVGENQVLNIDGDIFVSGSGMIRGIVSDE
jgi:hypothetical protein